jgi:hypothetical protein
MACHFKFDGTLDRSAAERAQGRSDRSPILDGLVTAIREADTHEVLVRIVENIRIDARYFELGDVLNLLERVDFDGTVRYRTDQMAAFAYYRFRRCRERESANVRRFDP